MNYPKCLYRLGTAFVWEGRSFDGITVFDEVGEGDALASGWKDMTSLLADPLDHDGDERKGGRKPNKLPALTGKSKADLLAIAEAEGVEVDDTMTMPDIRAAIELARERP